jgi:uncharacterized membrane protein
MEPAGRASDADGMETKEPAVTVETHQPSDMMSAKTMFRIGIALVLGAVAFFLRYSFEQGWIDPPVQLGMAAGAGLAMIVAGSQMVGRRILYGNLLQGAGGATLYLTAFAAQRRLDAVDLTTGFVLLVAVSAGVVGLALRRRSEMLAGTGLTGAIAAPVLIGGTITAFPGDSGYLMVVLAAAGALYLWRSWLWTFIATSAGVTAVLGLDVVVGLGGRGDPAGLQLGLAGLWILVWGVSMIGAVRRPDDELRASVVPAVTSAAMPLAAYLGTVVVWGDALPAPARMAIALGMATAHGVALLWLRTTRVPALLVYAQTAPITVLAAMAWIEGLDGHAILLAFAVQAVVMIVTGVRRHVDVVAYLGHVLAIVTAGAWMVMSFEPDGVFDMNDVLSAAVVACAVVAAVLIRESDEPRCPCRLPCCGPRHRSATSPRDRRS